MPTYKIVDKKIVPLERTTFAKLGLRERQDIQALMKSRIEVICPDTLVVAEEFGEWEDSKRRIDLLCIDKSANLVVIELKRTEDGGHMDLQAIRYAAMISTLTFQKLVGIYADYLRKNNIEKDAAESLLEFLGWNEPEEDLFGQEVKIVLASAEFSKELTTSVMWLNEYGLDIRCVRMHPYSDGSQVLLDVQTFIPIPEVADYQVRIREKKQKERESREDTRDLTKYDVQIAGKSYVSQAKRWLMFRLISGVLAGGGSPEDVKDAIPWRANRLFHIFDGVLNADEVRVRLLEINPGAAIALSRRYFCDDGQLFSVEGKTYVLSNQWGQRTLEAAENLKTAFPALNIEIHPTLVAADAEE